MERLNGLEPNPWLPPGWGVSTGWNPWVPFKVPKSAGEGDRFASSGLGRDLGDEEGQNRANSGKNTINRGKILKNLWKSGFLG
jgi:hypothetical protein